MGFEVITSLERLAALFARAGHVGVCGVRAFSMVVDALDVADTQR